MRGVEAGQVGDAGKVRRLVDGDDLELPGQPGLVQRAQIAAADATIAVDRNAERGNGILTAAWGLPAWGTQKARGAWTKKGAA
jgi:hypothetical protein